MSDSALQIAEQLGKSKNSALQSAVTSANQDATQQFTAMQRAADTAVSQIRAYVERDNNDKCEHIEAVVAAIESTMAKLGTLTDRFSATIHDALSELCDLEDQKQRLNQEFEAGVQSIMAARAQQP